MMDKLCIVHVYVPTAPGEGRWRQDAVFLSKGCCRELS